MKALQEFRIYKPTKEKKGAASKLELRQKEVQKGDFTYQEWMMFWTGANQTGEDASGNASFDWKTKEKPGKEVVLKLGDPDIGDLLAVLNKSKDKVGGPQGKGLYHQNDRGNSSLSFEFVKSNNPQYDDSYRFRLSSKIGDAPVLEVKHTITLAEAEIIKEILTGYIRKKYLQ
jgi:hypothetical protein